MDRLTARAVDTLSPTSVSTKARLRRWQKFRETFPHIGDMHVLDLGGTPNYWSNAPEMPAHVTVVNLCDQDSTDRVTAIQGDACNPPASAEGKYDLVVSNSLLEPVGGHAQRARLADVIHRSSDRHWVQTPYRYFPVEPHWVAPGFQFLPFEARVRAMMLWKFGNSPTPDREAAISLVNDIELIGLTQMQLFP